jgi:hypothetical protein
MLDALVPSATYAELPRVLADWYAELGDTIALPVPADPSRDAELAAVVAALRRR